MVRCEFLKDDYLEIYRLTSDEENYLDNDTEASLAKGRLVMECILSTLDANGVTNFDKINNLYDRRIIDYTIKEIFHKVRMLCNEGGTHYTAALQGSHANEALNGIVKLLIWLYCVRDKKSLPNAGSYFANADDYNFYKQYTEKFPGKINVYKDLDVNPLGVSHFSASDFGDEEQNVFVKDVFETDEEYHDRIESMDYMHIGYAILDKSKADKYTGAVFGLFHIDSNPQMVQASKAVFYAEAEAFSDAVFDGEIKAKLIERDGRVFCNYDDVQLINVDGTRIKLKAVHWNKYEYESEAQFYKRFETMSDLPIGLCIPLRNRYDITTEQLPFKISLFSYVSEIFSLDELVFKASREKAKPLCVGRQEYIICGKVQAYGSKYYIQSFKIVNSQGQILLADRLTDETVLSCFGAKTKKQLEKEKQAFVDSIMKNRKVMLGRYPQGANGEVKPIEWSVLEVKGNQALIISKYGLDVKPFNNEDSSITWDQCTLRKWLNNEFLKKAFNSEETSEIAEILVIAEKNPEYSTCQGNNTKDRVFLLNIQEAYKYFQTSEARKTPPTEYAVKQGAYRSDGQCWWWLRSSGDYSNDAAYVRTDGVVGGYGHRVYNDAGAVRPALWLNLKS